VRRRQNRRQRARKPASGPGPENAGASTAAPTETTSSPAPAAQTHATSAPLTTAANSTRDILPWVVVVCVVSLAIRLFHLWQIRDAPFFSLMMGDAQSYHAWAQDIAAGDWIGSDVFYQAPLYPYFLATVYTLFGEGSVVVRVIQAVIGSLGCGCLVFVGWRLFSKPVGVVAGLMLALYAPAIFFDGLVQKSVLDAFLLCVTLVLLGEMTTHELRPGGLFRLASSAPWALGVGAAIGCLTLTRENAVVFAVAVLGWLLWSRRDVMAGRLKLAGLVLAGLAIVLLPVAVRNLVVSGEFHLTTSQFGPNFYIGNHQDAPGTYQPLRFGGGDPKYERQDATELAEEATGRTLTPAEVSRYWTGRTLDDIRAEPGAWLRLLGRKLMLVWNASEVADTEDQLSYADWSFLLRMLGHIWHFGVLAPLALFGAWSAWAHRRRVALLCLLLGGYTAALVAFAVMARYRYPLVPILILLAAVGVVRLRALVFDWPTPSRQRPALAAALGATLLAAIVCNWPMYSMAQMRALTESNLGTELQSQGRFDEAIVFYRTALTRDPLDAVSHSNLGSALAATGDVATAVIHYERALELAPGDADSHYNLANMLTAEERRPEAIRHFREALRLEPGFADAHINLGNALVAEGQTAEAATHYRRGTELSPDNAEAFNNLGLLTAGQGDLQDAIKQFGHALRLDPSFAEAHTNLGSVLRETGESDRAVTHLRRVVELQPESSSAYNDLGIALGSQGELDAAMEQFQRALSLDRENVAAHNNLATVFQLRGDLAAAIAQYRTILTIDPLLATAHNDLGILLAQQDDIDGATDHFRQAVALDANLGEAHGNLGTALYLQGNVDDAISHYREALRIAPDNNELRNQLDAALAAR